MESMQAFAAVMPSLIAVGTAALALLVLLGKAHITSPFTLQRASRRRERLIAWLTIALQAAVMLALVLGLGGRLAPWLPVAAVALAGILAALLDKALPADTSVS